MWKKNNSFCTLSKDVSWHVLPFQKVSVFETENTIFTQRNEMYSKEDYQFLSPFRMWIRTSISMAKSFSVWNWIHSFQSKEQKVCWRSLSIFVTFQKMYSDKKRQVLPCQKVQCLKLNILFFNPRNEIYLEEDYQLLEPFKKCIPKSTCILKTSVFENEYLFSIKITKCMWRKTINICHLPKNVFRQKLPCQKNSVFEISYNFSTNGCKCMEKQSMTIILFSPFKKWITTSTSFHAKKF